MARKSLEEVLGLVGQWGRYQKRVFCMVCMCAIPCGMTALSWVFVGAVPKHRCFLPLIDTGDAVSYNISYADYEANIPYELNPEPTISDVAANRWLRSQCTRYNPPMKANEGENISRISTVEKCGKFVYDRSIYTHATVATEFDLVCDNAWKHSLVQSLYMVGILLGSLCVGELADRIGRKPALAASITMAIVVGILNYFSWSYAFFAVTRCLQGLFLTGFYLMSVVLGMELVGPDKRIFAGVMISGGFAVGEMLMGLLAYAVRDWRLLQLIICVMILLYLAVLYFIPESVRWLYSRRRYEKAEVILEQIAYENGVSLNRQWLLELRQSHDHGHLQAADERSDEVNLRSRARFWSRLEIFFHRNMRKNFAVQLLCWFVASMVYYGLSMETQSLGGNDFANSILVSAVELPTYLILWIILDPCGRRIPLLLCFTLAGLACFALAIWPVISSTGGLSMLAFALLGKAGISAAFSICYIYAAELFPTKFRSQALGLCAMIGHAGPILSPFIALLANVDKALPYLIFGGFAIAAALASPILPETAGCALPETVEEAELLGSRRSNATRRRVTRENIENVPPSSQFAVAVAEDEPLLGTEKS